MITAKEIQQKARDEFYQTFDFAAFDAAVEDYFVNKRLNHLHIGLEYDSYVAKKVKDGECKTLSFVKGYSCGYWYTNIQIAHSIEDFVAEYLRDHGFGISKQGLCGSGYMDVMIVSI